MRDVVPYRPGQKDQWPVEDGADPDSSRAPARGQSPEPEPGRGGPGDESPDQAPATGMLPYRRGPKGPSGPPERGWT